MSYAISIDKPQGIVVVRFWNAVTNDEFLNYLDELEIYGTFDSAFSFLLLMEAGLSLDIPANTIRNQAKRPPQFAADAYSVVKDMDSACQILEIDRQNLRMPSRDA